MTVTGKRHSEPSPAAIGLALHRPKSIASSWTGRRPHSAASYSIWEARIKSGLQYGGRPDFALCKGVSEMFQFREEIPPGHAVKFLVGGKSHDRLPRRHQPL